MPYEDILNQISSLDPLEQDALQARLDELRQERSSGFPQIKESIEIQTYGSTASVVIDGVEYASNILKFEITSEGISIDWTTFADDGNFAKDGKTMINLDLETQRYFRVHYAGVYFKISGDRIYPVSTEDKPCD